jgi:hypothetical protein
MLLHIQCAQDLLDIIATGKFSLREAKRTFVEMLEAVALHDARKVLLDGRELIGNPEVMERFYYGEFAAKSVSEYSKRGVSSATAFAYVLREPVLDPDRFGETVALNRGMNVKTFKTLPEALQWLGRPGAALARSNSP